MQNVRLVSGAPTVQRRIQTHGNKGYRNGNAAVFVLPYFQSEAKNEKDRYTYADLWNDTGDIFS